jgi:hypothetical protein
VSFSLTDGTVVAVDKTFDASLPVVILLHGLGGNSLDMTAPASPASSVAGLAFDRTATYALYKNEGFHFAPPILPVANFYLDPGVTSLTSWRDALQSAGFCTVSYSQIKGSVAKAVTQLTELVTTLENDPKAAPELKGLRIAFVAHSRGGPIARSCLVAAAAAAAANSALASFMARVTTLITLHSPHFGSGVASLAGTVDAQLASLQAGFASLGIIPPAFLTTLRLTTGDPFVLELAPGSPAVAIAAGEPVPGIAYHTFGGTSTAFARLWASVYTPDSSFPLWPFPVFHWGSTPAFVGTPLDIVSFAPVAPILASLPVVQQIMATLTRLVATAPEFGPGIGDLLVTDASAHLPFSTTRTTNPLNHAEALWDPTLQAQVVAILSRLQTHTVPANWVVVPDVLDSPNPANAANQIRAVGLVPVLHGPYGPPYGSRQNYVSRQSPVPGVRVAPGSAVNLYLKRGVPL